MPDTAPLVQKLIATVPSQTAATVADQALGESPWAGTLTNATFTPDAAITGNTTNTRTFTIVNKGQAGAGTTIMATLAYITGTNGVANDEQAFTLSGTPANLVTVAGDILQVNEVVAGSGLANPGGLVQAELTRS
jgi:hypothetical protein